MTRAAAFWAGVLLGVAAPIIGAVLGTVIHDRSQGRLGL